MLRTERVMLDKMQVGRSTEETLLLKVKSCLADAVAVTEGLKDRLGGGSTFVTVDIGRFGSKSWKERENPGHETKEKIFETVQQSIMDDFLHTNLQFDQYEDLFINITGGKDDPGYVAALQQAIASRADCLVIVGGGNFMEVALEQYLRNHPSHLGHCVHLLCVSKRFRDEYRQLMEQVKRTLKQAV